uniref:Uncharacterized protein n=1 Tax=Molossus molossus TaxID=27622 RepID=A0A7J8DBX8_MOLMO|nr:hypothetical protein HJG59_009370 [Molossus molossus]
MGVSAGACLPWGLPDTAAGRGLRLLVGVSVPVSVSPFISDPAWDASAIVWLSALGNSRFFYIPMSLDGDRLVQGSRFSLEKGHPVTSALTLLPHFCTSFVLLLLLGVEQLQETQTLAFKTNISLFIDF